MSYESFLELHGEARDNDIVGFDRRKALFEQKLEAINAHNADPANTWTMGVNRFTDYTEEEFGQLLGHKSFLKGTASDGLLAYAGGSSASSSFLEVKKSRTRQSEIATGGVSNRNWAASTGFVAKDQGPCGSCWAVAVAVVAELRLHELYPNKTIRPLAFEQMVACTADPQECGGKGGCDGATAELGLEYVTKNGLTSKERWDKVAKYKDLNKCTWTKEDAPPVVTFDGFVKLPDNDLEALYKVLMEDGPVVVSVDASTWSGYSGGVFTGCKPDAVVNHAVALIGFGKADTDKYVHDYWIVRNSWGPGWGVDGNIMIQRHTGDVYNKKDGHCGTDKDPKAGVGCKNGPKQMEVCGMCGILSDSSYPVGLKLVE